MDPHLHRRIVLVTLGIAGMAALLGGLLSGDRRIVAGFLFGCLARLAGFRQIIRMVSRIEKSARPKQTGVTNYLFRYLFYGVVIALCLKGGVNVFSLLFGFISLDLAILLITALEKKKGA